MIADEGCSAIKGTTGLSQLLQNSDTKPIHAVIGASCDAACLPAGYLAAGSNLPQISNGCSSGTSNPALRPPRSPLPHDGCSTDVFPSPLVCAPFSSDLLSNKGNYPTFLRTVPPKPLYKYAIAGLMRWANWNRVMMLSSLAQSFAGLAFAFRKMAPSINVTITYQYAFEQTELDKNDLDESVMTGLERPRTRVVLLVCYDRNIKRIALQAWRRKSLIGDPPGKGWAWIASSDILAAEKAVLQPIDIPEAAAQIALNGWLFFELAVPDDAQFTAAVKVRTTADFNIPVDNAAPMSSSAASLYDAIMLWAMACNGLTLDQCKTNPSNIVFQTMLNTTFQGKSGFVKLDESGDVIPAAFSLYNYVRIPVDMNASKAITYKMNKILIGTYTTDSKMFVRTKDPIIWPGDGPEKHVASGFDQIPSDQALRIAVLVPAFGTLPSSRSLIAAADVAVKGLNERAASLLAGKQLMYEYREVKCDSSASAAAISILLEEGPLDAVIGGFCSTGCESSAFLTAGRDIPQISYGCTSAALSDKEKYPTVRSPLSEFVLACFTMYPFGVSSIVRCAVLADHIDVHQLGACHLSIC